MKKIFLIVSACAALAACQKESDNSATTSFVKGQKVTLSAALVSDNETRVISTHTIGTPGIKSVWHHEDSILVTVGTKSSVFHLVWGTAGKADAKFEGEMPATGNTFNVQFPVEKPNLTDQAFSWNESKNEVYLPENKMLQTAENCTLDKGFTLVPQYSVLRLNLYGFTNDNKIGMIKVIVGNETYCLDCSGGFTTGGDESSASPFFIVVPAGTYSFKVRVYDYDDGLNLISMFAPAQTQTFTAGKILNMPAKTLEMPKYIEKAGLYKYEGSAVACGDVIWAPINCGYDNPNNPETQVHGALYQWGRNKYCLYDCSWEETISTAVENRSDASQNNNSRYTVTPWYTSYKTTDVWSDMKPCPDGWRIPTSAELNKLIDKGESSYRVGQYTDYQGKSHQYSFLKCGNVHLEISGYKKYDASGTGGQWRDVSGFYWCKEAAKTLWIEKIQDEEIVIHKDYGCDISHACSVRCIWEGNDK